MRRRIIEWVFVLVALASVAGQAAAQASSPSFRTSVTDTVHVAPPTGQPETDRARVQEAFDRVGPGGTVLFAHGTYVLGEGARLTVPDVTVLGHPDGTVLQGCDPERFELVEGFGMDDVYAIGWGCTGLFVLADRQIIRGLTFDHTWHGIYVGPLWSPTGEPPTEPGFGGHRIENNVFRHVPNGIRVVGPTDAPTVIRDNEVVNAYHAFQSNGAIVHVIDNRITVPEPETVPAAYYPESAVMLSPAPLSGSCQGSRVVGNVVDGTVHGIQVLAGGARGTCSDHEIRDNVIRIRQVPLPTGYPRHLRDFYFGEEAQGSAVAGTAIRLHGEVLGPADGGAAAITDVVIQDNRVVGGDGLGIQLSSASGNRIVGNHISAIRRRSPFPGLTWGDDPNRWREANGSGIWISPGSDENVVAGNAFEDVEGAEVFLEGDRNRVELRSTGDSVRDLGGDNEVTRAEVRGRSDSLPHEAGFVTGDQTDTLRYVEIVDGHVLGEWRTWQEVPDTWGYSLDKHYHFQRSGRLTLNAEGTPVRMETTGEVDPGIPWYERFGFEDDTARWATPRERGGANIDGPAYYAAVYPAHDLGVLARALLRSPTGALPLLPEGEARLEPLAERRVSAGGRSRTVRLYAIHGLDLLPRYVWLDPDGATFAEEWSILAGWETAFPGLRAAVDDALSEFRRDLARELSPADRAGPLVIRGARLFDAGTGRVRENMTIVIEVNRITAVDAAGRVDLPVGAEVIEAEGRMALPGLWDMHGHLSSPASNDPMFDRGGELLHLAGGVTTVRDVGSHVASLVALRTAIDAGAAIGPRIVGAGFIDGPDGAPEFGIIVGTADEAREAVDRYAELGFPQVKIHGWLPRELVHVVIARAKEHGMRVSGHVPDELSGREAVDAGFDEIQHIWWMVWAIPMSNEEALAGGATWDDFYHVIAELTPDSEPVRDFVALLTAHGIALDATLGYFVSENIPPDFIADVVERFPAPVERRLRHKAWQPNYFPKSPLVRPVREKAVANLFELLPMLHREGIPILVGSDTWPGFGLHYEMELLVEAGIPAPEVLALATLGAARAMEMDDELGSIEPGKLADLILVVGDPTTDISDIRRVVTVIKDGRVYDSAAIYRALGIQPRCEK